MAPAPFLVPALAALRNEFNLISPGRDKGADGWIGDEAHKERTSDHNPDSAGRVLAVDIDSSGPWPDRTWFDLAVRRLVDDQGAGRDARLEYVIWNRRIASHDRGWVWREYTGSNDPHTNHAHFSARHDHTGNNSSAPWGLQKGPDMPLGDDLIKITEDTAAEIGNKAGASVSAATLLQLAVIFAARGDDKAELARRAAAAAADDIEQIKADIAAIKTKPAGSAGAVDLDALADKVVDRIAARIAAA